MARDDSRALLRLVYMSHLDGAGPSRTLGWVSLVAPVVTQAAAGAGHWAAGRRQRALAEWAGARLGPVPRIILRSTARTSRGRETRTVRTKISAVPGTEGQLGTA